MAKIAASVLLKLFSGKSPVTPERRPHSVQKVADCRGAPCAIA